MCHRGMPPGLTTCPSTLTPIPASTFSHLGPASHSPPCLHPCLSIVHREVRMFFKNVIQIFRSFKVLLPLHPQPRCLLDFSPLPSLLPALCREATPAFLPFFKEPSACDLGTSWSALPSPKPCSASCSIPTPLSPHRGLPAPVPPLCVLTLLFHSISYFLFMFVHFYH